MVQQPVNYELALRHNLEDFKSISYSKAIVSAQLDQALAKVQELEMENKRLQDEINNLTKKSEEEPVEEPEEVVEEGPESEVEASTN